MNEMGIRYLRNRAALYGMGVMVICGIISLPISGFNLSLIGGLVLGAAVSSLNIFLLGFFTERALTRGQGFLGTIGFILRMLIYGGAFAVSLTMMGTVAAIGTAIGFMTAYAALFYLSGVRPWLLKKIRQSAVRAGKVPQEEAPVLEYVYETAIRDANGKRRYMFVKSFSMSAYRGGRTYITYRQFKRLKEIRERKAHA
jgi:hypothetical protein